MKGEKYVTVWNPYSIKISGNMVHFWDYSRICHHKMPKTLYETITRSAGVKNDVPRV